MKVGEKAFILSLRPSDSPERWMGTLAVIYVLISVLNHNSAVKRLLQETIVTRSMLMPGWTDCP